MSVEDEGRWIDAERARHLASGLVALISGTMLLAWIAQLEVATRTDTLAPMSPVSCIGFFSAAIGTAALPGRRRAAIGAGVFASVTGVLGLLGDGRAVNDALFGTRAAVSTFTAFALILLGAAGHSPASSRSFRGRSAARP
jgi:hypothetical protein